MGDELPSNATTSDFANPSVPPPPQPPVVAEIVWPEPDWTPPPRIWPALVVGIGTMPVALCVQLFAVIVIIFIGFGLPTPDKLPAIRDWFGEFIYTGPGLAVLVLPGQAVFLCSALLAAKISPQRFSERLALQAGRQPLWTWLACALATPMIGFITSALLSLVMDDPGENMEMLQKLFRSQESSFMPAVLLMLAVLPGFGEEALFRGYVQSRLLKRLPAAAAIAISTLLFSVAHLDPKHVLAVIPLGAWLGIVAWRSGTIWPSIFGHMLNNALAVWLTRIGTDDGTEIQFDSLSLSLYGVCGTALIVAIYAMVRDGNLPTPAVSLPDSPTSAPPGTA